MQRTWIFFGVVFLLAVGVSYADDEALLELLDLSEQPAESVEVDLFAPLFNQLQELEEWRRQATAQLEGLHAENYELKEKLGSIPSLEWFDKFLAVLQENSELRQSNISLVVRAEAAEEAIPTLQRQMEDLRRNFEQFRQQAPSDLAAAGQQWRALVNNDIRQAVEPFRKEIDRMKEVIKNTFIQLGRQIFW